MFGAPRERSIERVSAFSIRLKRVVKVSGVTGHTGMAKGSLIAEWPCFFSGAVFEETVLW